MYKLFLTFRYLTRKKIVVFPVLVVWLCVMMLIIVTSIMGGFVDRVREANRDLYGDIIISSDSSSQGFAGYDALAAELKGKFAEITATTPVVEAVAILYVPYAQESRPALLVGVKPDERSQVTKFRESLFQQYQAPMNAVEDLAKWLPGDKPKLVAKATEERDTRQQAYDKTLDELRKLGAAAVGGVLPPAAPRWAQIAWSVPVVLAAISFFVFAWSRRRGWHYFYGAVTLVLGLGVVTLAALWPVIFPAQYGLAEDRAHQARMAMERALRAVDYAQALPEKNYATRDDLTQAIVPAKAGFDLPPEAAKDDTLPKQGAIIGSQVGFFARDTRGNFVHPYPWIYPKVTITVFPPSHSGKININATNAVTQDFTIVDDSHTGMFEVDYQDAYAPFETVQLMAGMRPDPKLVAQTPDADFEPRVHSLLIRVTPDSVPKLKELRARIDVEVEKFAESYGAAHHEPFPQSLQVQTWDEKQAKYLGAVENEKTMLTFIMLLMSGVVLVVIFLIFYQIVRDKTRDIGIIKAVGGSELGVAAIFLSYGLMIGIVGGGLGVLSGCLFVTHTNEIHEMIYQATGIIIWDRSVYLFDRIPDVVHLSDVITYFCVALVAGVVGALIPAIIAAAEDPVQAVRYE